MSTGRVPPAPGDILSRAVACAGESDVSLGSTRDESLPSQETRRARALRDTSHWDPIHGYGRNIRDREKRRKPGLTMRTPLHTLANWVLVAAFVAGFVVLAIWLAGIR